MTSSLLHNFIYSLLIIVYISTTEILGQRISGPNVCGSTRSRCCRGWRLSQSRRCTVPICNNCQDGGCACLAPNRCSCQETIHITKREVIMKGDSFKGRCKDTKNPCSQSCRDLQGFRYSCDCYRGFSLNSDQRTCERSRTDFTVDINELGLPELQLNTREKEEINHYMLKEKQFFIYAFSDIINSLEHMQISDSQVNSLEHMQISDSQVNSLEHMQISDSQVNSLEHMQISDSQDPTKTKDYINKMVFNVLEGKLNFTRTKKYVLNTDWVSGLKTLDSTVLPESIIKLRKIIITTLLGLYSEDINKDINDKGEQVKQDKESKVPSEQLNNSKLKYLTKPRNSSTSRPTNSSKSITPLTPNMNLSNPLQDKYKTPNKRININSTTAVPKKNTSKFLRKPQHLSRQKSKINMKTYKSRSREDKLFLKSVESMGLTLKPNVFSLVKDDTKGSPSTKNSLYKSKNEKLMDSVIPKQKYKQWNKLEEIHFGESDIKSEYFPEKRPKGDDWDKKILFFV